MLSPHPEAITFLRGLYAEESALETMLAATDPKKAISCDNAKVNVFQRQSGKTRWLIAMRPGGAADGSTTSAKFVVPADVATAETLFEARTLSVDGNSWQDHFAGSALFTFIESLSGDVRTVRGPRMQ